MSPREQREIVGLATKHGIKTKALDDGVMMWEPLPSQTMAGVDRATVARKIIGLMRKGVSLCDAAERELFKRKPQGKFRTMDKIVKLIKSDRTLAKVFKTRCPL